ncbi:lamin tail domain-containing protein [Verrucomicrobiaceae bacterium N1E253]|uniref:Lamin tail domain-containing protein n=1 Tax=Oceaniferula marina TaxID=2748318 RepID=A0A851GBD7_9BACT|nr:lamin tail domain-containing protein [Oceaniferula marina]NWK54923.1 lamin tail domain-containing protein [Oceaniferula marina]
MKRTSLSLLAATFCVMLPGLLSANPVISEFVASNDGSHLDEDGDASDWIEIKNNSSSPISLNNWKLSDDASLPGKWSFPEISLGPGEHLIVFASGKNRAQSNAELHTNFSLSQSGEYLALTAPDGSVASEFAPSYPPQETGSSYGVSTPSNEVVLISEDDACKAYVPDSSYHTLVGDTWKTNTPVFDDSGWLSGTQGVGYDEKTGYDSDIGLDVEAIMSDINPSVYIRIPITSTIDPNNILSLTLRAKFEDGFASYINGVAPANGSSFAPNPVTWNSSTEGGNSPESQAGVFQEFDLSDTIPHLVAGNNNLLAVQGLNAAAGSSDYLFRAELVAQVADAGATTTGYFDTPSPGTINGSTTYAGLLGDTSFQVGRGFYYTLFNETVTCDDPGSTIIYTTDGTLPSLTNGTKVPASDEFSTPLAIVPIHTTTTLRAIAIKEGYRPTNVDTQTYLFLNDVLKQDGDGLPIYERASTDPNYRGPAVWDYEMDGQIIHDPRYANLIDDLQSLPTLSITMPVEDIWGSNGIYRNQTMEGSAWERECSVEIIHPDGSPGYQVNGGLRMQGSGSRARSVGKKSMRIAFRKDYGSSRFKYPLWGSTGPTEVSNIVLRGSYFDSWTVHSDSGTMEGVSRTSALQFRTHYATLAHARTGNLTVASNWVHLYINGQYWGPYNTHERPDGEFAELHNGGDESDYTVIKTKGELIQGTKTAWNALMTLCNNYTGGFDATQHQQILDQIDQDQFIDYMFANIWGANNDWPHNNWYVHRNDTLNGPFLFYIWDPEHYIWTNSDRTGVSDSGSPGIIYDRLRRGPEFQVHFGDRVHKLMFNDGVYSLANMLTLFQDIAEELEPAMNCESARWGDEHADTPYNTIDHWLPQVAYRKNTWIPARQTTVLNQLRSRNLYPDTAAPVFSQHGGTILSGYPLTMSNPDDVGNIFFTTDGSDPRLTGGSNSTSAQTYSGPVTLEPGPQGITVKARVKNSNGEWSALNEAHFTIGAQPSTSTLVISEFNYNPGEPTSAESNAGFTDNDDFEFIELLNTGSTTLDLRNLAFDNNIEGIDFDFTNVPTPLLTPGSRIVLAKNSAAYAFRYGNSEQVAGNYSGKLSNGGETITLLHRGSPMIAFAYNDKYPWPISADGQGTSLVLINPMSNPDHGLADNWRASGTTHGTPESKEVLPESPALPLADANGNGRADLIDYLIIGRPQTGMHNLGGVEHYQTLTFTINPLAEAARASVQYSENLSQWSSADSDIDLISETFNGDGTITYQWQCLTPQSTGKCQFMRLKVEQR